MSSFPRNLFPVTFKKPPPGTESPYNVHTSQLFPEEKEELKETSESDCQHTCCCCLHEPELNIYRLFYFLFYAATALFAYLPLYYKESLLLDRHHVGLLMGIRPFIKFLAAPFLGTLADKFNKYKSILYIGLLAYIVVYLSITFVSGVPASCGVMQANATKVIGQNVSLTNSGRRSSTINSNNNGSTIKVRTLDGSEQLSAGELRHARETDMDNGERLSISDDADLPIPANENNGDPEMIRFELGYYDNSTEGSSKGADTWLGAPDVANEDSWPLDVYDWKTKGNPPEKKQVRERIFMILLLLTLAAEFLGAPILSLVDTATLQNLKKEPHRYGHQRVWGSVGFGLMSIAFGIVLHFTVTTQEEIEHCPAKMVDKYRPVFYACCSLLILALFSTLNFKFRVYEGKDTSGCSVFKCIKYFRNIEYCLFVFLAWFTGLGHGLTAAFLFVHLIRLGATPLVLLVATTLQAVSKVIFYVLSPMLIAKYGSFPIIYAGLISNVVIFFYYSFLTTPWMVVPIELLTGLSSSCVWVALVSYVGAPPKIGATLQGILHAVHIGLGRGIGGLFGGMILVHYGFDWLFRSFSLVSFVVFFSVFGFRYWRNQEEEPIWKKLWDYSPIAPNDEFSDSD